MTHLKPKAFGIVKKIQKTGGQALPVHPGQALKNPVPGKRRVDPRFGPETPPAGQGLKFRQMGHSPGKQGSQRPFPGIFSPLPVGVQ
jgi:hypothetical protein